MGDVSVSSIQIGEPCASWRTATGDPCGLPSTVKIASGCSVCKTVRTTPRCEEHAASTLDAMSRGTLACKDDHGQILLLEAIRIKPVEVAPAGVLSISFDEETP